MGYTTKDGYGMISQGRGHRMFAHRLVMTAHLGRELSSSEVVHHDDENKLNNKVENLQVLSRSEHSILHASRVAAAACGNPDFRQCCYCHKYDDLLNLSRSQRRVFHPKCRNEYRRERYRKGLPR